MVAELVNAIPPDLPPYHSDPPQPLGLPQYVSLRDMAAPGCMVIGTFSFFLLMFSLVESVRLQGADGVERV
jgi:hypothetical protein